MKERTRRILTLLGMLLVLTGAGIRLYPYVTNWYLEYTSRMEIQDYREAISGESEQEIADMKEEAHTYNTALQEQEPGGEQELASLESYNDILAATDAIGYLEIPKIDVYLPIYHGTDEETLQRGIGHMEGTSLPVGGESSHCVLSGHTGLPTANLFTHLDEMEIGDLFYIHVLDETLAYQVDQINVVLPDETDLIAITEGKDYVTLLTCIPYGVNSHRLLVRGERTSYEETQSLTVQAPREEPAQEKMISPGWILAAGGALLVLLVALLSLAILCPEKFRRRHKNTTEDKE